jgi:thiamine-monophosphate kinase
VTWSEDAVHRWLARRPRPTRLVGSAMHDAAVLRAPAGRLVACADQAIEGQHAREGISAAALAAKCVLRALSDLAATCAEPHAVLLCVQAPRSRTNSELRRAIEAASKAARAHGADLVGGDLAATDGPLSFAATALGSWSGGRSVGRDRARVGDELWLSGPLGGSILGRHLRPRPRFDAARAFVDHGARVLMDVSDGLLLDARRIARASGARLLVELASVPVHRDARRLALRDGTPPLEHALRDGEDHELLACLSRADAARLVASGAAARLGLARIGAVARGAGVVLVRRDGSLEIPLGPGGWIHGAQR